MGVRVLIVEDHGLVRQGLRMYLALDPELEVVGEAANCAEALRRTRDTLRAMYVDGEDVVLRYAMEALRGE